MLVEQLRKQWRARHAVGYIEPAMTLKADGLVLVLSQSLNRVQASQGRPIEWFFPNESAAAYARKLFDDNKGGRERITILVLPWPGVDK